MILTRKITALSTGPGATSLYVVRSKLGDANKVWTKFFPDSDNPGKWTDWFDLGPIPHN
jgi:hypothetical protein